MMGILKDIDASGGSIYRKNKNCIFSSFISKK
jgi:hypothetical protein